MMELLRRILPPENVLKKEEKEIMIRTDLSTVAYHAAAELARWQELSQWYLISPDNDLGMHITRMTQALGKNVDVYYRLFDEDFVSYLESLMPTIEREEKDFTLVVGKNFEQYAANTYFPQLYSTRIAKEYNIKVAETLGERLRRSKKRLVVVTHIGDSMAQQVVDYAIRCARESVDRDWFFNLPESDDDSY